jgi:hypothetical protein
VLVGWLIDWLVGDHLLLRYIEPYGVIFMDVCDVITVTMGSDFWACGIIFISNVCLILYIFPSFLTGSLLVYT